MSSFSDEAFAIRETTPLEARARLSRVPFAECELGSNKYKAVDNGLVINVGGQASASSNAASASLSHPWGKKPSWSFGRAPDAIGVSHPRVKKNFSLAVVPGTQRLFLRQSENDKMVSIDLARSRNRTIFPLHDGMEITFCAAEPSPPNNGTTTTTSSSPRREEDAYRTLTIRAPHMRVLFKESVWYDGRNPDEQSEQSIISDVSMSSMDELLTQHSSSTLGTGGGLDSSTNSSSDNSYVPPPAHEQQQQHTSESTAVAPPPPTKSSGGGGFKMYLPSSTRRSASSSILKSSATPAAAAAATAATTATTSTSPPGSGILSSSTTTPTSTMEKKTISWMDMASSNREGGGNSQGANEQQQQQQLQWEEEASDLDATYANAKFCVLGEGGEGDTLVALDANTRVVHIGTDPTVCAIVIPNIFPGGQTRRVVASLVWYSVKCCCLSLPITLDPACSIRVALRHKLLFPLEPDDCIRFTGVRAPSDPAGRLTIRVPALVRHMDPSAPSALPPSRSHQFMNEIALELSTQVLRGERFTGVRVAAATTAPPKVFDFTDKWFAKHSQCVIGRSHDGSHIHVEDTKMSRHHICFECNRLGSNKSETSHFTVRALSSKRQTYLLLGKSETHTRGGLALRSGDSFFCGRTEFKVVYQQRGNRSLPAFLDARDELEERHSLRKASELLRLNASGGVAGPRGEEADAPTFPSLLLEEPKFHNLDDLTRFLGVDSLGESPVMILMSTRGPKSRRLYMVNPIETLVGSSPHADIAVESDLRMSPIHCRLCFDVRAGRWLLHDMQSTHGTFLKLTKDFTTVLTPGDVLVMGLTVVRVLGAPACVAKNDPPPPLPLPTPVASPTNNNNDNNSGSGNNSSTSGTKSVSKGVIGMLTGSRGSVSSSTADTGGTAGGSSKSRKRQPSPQQQHQQQQQHSSATSTAKGSGAGSGAKPSSRETGSRCPVS